MSTDRISVARVAEQAAAERAIEQPRREVLKSLWILLLTIAAIVIFSKHAASEPQPEGTSKVPATEQEERVATFAGGCFWCTEAVFERLDGVGDVISGYIGGTVRNPTYEQVCDKKTGHAEAVEIYYDPAKVEYEELLEIFFKTHDPTMLNAQGPDRGPQYRSSVFYHDADQKKAAAKYIKKLSDSGDYDRKIVTQLEKATTFYPAEEYHQDYFRRNPNDRYCNAIAVPKIRKLNRDFGDKIKKNSSKRSN